MFLLDTCVVSELRKVEPKADPGLLKWAAKTPATSMYLSTISLYELELGVLLMERRDSISGDVLRTWLSETVIPTFAKRLLPIDGRVAVRASALHVPNPAPLADSFIGATALVHGMALVTRNAGDFERFDGLKVVNPFRGT
jgi:predicted nucleic acid-binding protein